MIGVFALQYFNYCKTLCFNIF